MKKYKVQISIRIKMINIFLFFFSSKRKKLLKKFNKKIKSLNHLVYISKLVYQKIANFILKFLGRRDLKAKKKSILAT